MRERFPNPLGADSSSEALERCSTTVVEELLRSARCDGSKVDSMTLKQAARRSSRSLTTLRRYIRSGRLAAKKKPGRFGPEYFVSEQALTEAGLQATAAGEPQPLVRRPATDLARSESDSRIAERLFRDSVPLSLYQELQMKHEQLLVQYGMVRAAGTKVLELRAAVEEKQLRLKAAQDRATSLSRRLAEETARFERQLREAELERKGRGLEIAALKEKVRGLEMFTRNARTSATVEQKYREIMEQTRRVERLSASQSTGDKGLAPRPDKRADRDH